MKIHIHKIKLFIKTHYIVSVLVFIAITYAIFAGFYGSTDNKEFFTVKSGDVVQKVIVNGKTKPVQAVSLGFENNGKIAGVYVGVGTKVFVGQTLANLEQGELSANLAKAEADVSGAESLLEELRVGSRPEEIANAITDVENARNTLAVKVLDSFTKVDDAIHNSVDQLFSNPKSFNPSFNLIISNFQLKTDIESRRLQIDPLLLSWKTNLGDISKEGIVETEANLLQIKSFVDLVADAINNKSADSNTSQTTLDAYKTALSSARTNINTAISNITSAKASLLSAEGELTLKQKGNTPEAIHTQEAKVLQNKAVVAGVKAQIAKMTLKSPINGIVTIQNAKVGEIVIPGKSVISIISDNNLEIESNVSEINIGKVAIGNKVNITLDAFPDEIFQGTVTYIEPAETIVDGVVNYKVLVAFDKQYPQMKSGLTSKLEILTSVKNNVLVIPEYAVVTVDGDTFVSKKIGNNFVQFPVTIGLHGQDGFVEVVNGLSASDTIEVAPSK